MEKSMLLQEIVLPFPGDSTEFSPIAEFQNILAVGSYQLNESDKTRSGELLFYSLQEKSGALKNICNISSTGILDLKWSSMRVTDKILLGSANAEGLTIFDCSELNSSMTPKPITSYKLDDPSCLSLSLDWNNRKESATTKIATSQSNKSLSLFSLDPSGLKLESNWSAHHHEVWVVAFNCYNTSQILSGSDDCTMKGWDVRESPSQPTFTRRFDAGVTSIQFSTLREHIFAVGSYDDHVRLFDIRSIRSALATSAMGGGVFRVKFHPHDPNRLATANMHNGFATLRIQEENSWKFLIEATHTKPHESLAYGTDWCHQSTSANVLASASFYDKRLTLWKTA